VPPRGADSVIGFEDIQQALKKMQNPPLVQIL
jgi:hypothetical protein